MTGSSQGYLGLCPHPTAVTGGNLEPQGKDLGGGASLHGWGAQGWGSRGIGGGCWPFPRTWPISHGGSDGI